MTDQPDRRIDLPSLGRSPDAEMDQEIESHLQMRIDDLVRAGMTPAQARAEAERRFGDMGEARQALHVAARRRESAQRHRDLGGAIVADVKFALRQLRRNIAHSTIAVATLALGIGVTTAIFTLVERVLINPLPFPHAEQLAYVQGRDSVGNSVMVVSNDDWLDWQEQTRSFSAFAAHSNPFRSTITVGDSAIRVTMATATGQFFRVLQPRFVVGRPFTPEEVAANTAGFVVSERFWRSALGADSSLRQTIGTPGRPVVGVVADGAAYPDDVDLWQPTTVASFGGGGTRNNIGLMAVGRLKPGVSMAAATADLNQVASNIRARDKGGLYDFGGSATPLQSLVVGDDAATSLRLLMECVFVVLLIVCANLAIATLGRGASRQQEMAIRSSLGAGRSRLVAQLLVEHLFLALLGGVAGFAVAWACVRLLVGAWGEWIPRASEVHLDGAVLAFAVGCSVLVGLIAGIAPALRGSRVSLQGMMQAGGKSTVRGKQRGATVLVIVEFALALMLLTGAGLLIRSFQNLIGRDLGFDRNLATMEIGLTSTRYRADSSLRLATWDRLIAAYRTIPSVEAVGVANWVPLGTAGAGFLDIAGRDGPNEGAGYRMVSEDYFRALGVRLLNGRSFQLQDAAGTDRVTVVNQTMARLFWPKESPIGQRVRAKSQESGPRGEPAPWLTVIGVVSDLRQHGLESAVQPEMFVSFRQAPQWRTAVLTAVVRSPLPPGQLFSQLRSRTREVDPRLTGDTRSMVAKLDGMLAPRRITMVLLTGFAVLALLLASLGIYAVLSYTVVRRSREIAMRGALGAQRSDLLLMILRNGISTVAIGMAIGLAASLALSRLMQAMLVDMSSVDPATFAAASVVLLAVGVGAILVPAVRATRLDPIIALRSE